MRGRLLLHFKTLDINEKLGLTSPLSVYFFCCCECLVIIQGLYNHSSRFVGRKRLLQDQRRVKCSTWKGSQGKFSNLPPLIIEVIIHALRRDVQWLCPFACPTFDFTLLVLGKASSWIDPPIQHLKGTFKA
jgi:hypothetical protein